MNNIECRDDDRISIPVIEYDALLKSKERLDKIEEALEQMPFDIDDIIGEEE